MDVECINSENAQYSEFDSLIAGRSSSSSWNGRIVSTDKGAPNLFAAHIHSHNDFEVILCAGGQASISAEIDAEKNTSAEAKIEVHSDDEKVSGSVSRNVTQGQDGHTEGSIKLNMTWDF